MPARTLVLDVDTGTDDALALLYAVGHPDLTIRGISCVAGNASLPQVVANTHKTLDAAGAPDIPVAAGAAKPLLERVQPGDAFHGEDGLAGIVLPGRRARSAGSPPWSSCGNRSWRPRAR
jgi:pyrimidine-specific ribonucleoside hydrolase